MRCGGKPELKSRARLFIFELTGTQSASKVENKLGFIFANFPHLAKNVYNFCRHVKDKKVVLGIVQETLASSRPLQEYQLFYLGAILEEYLLGISAGGDLIQRLFDHPNSQIITKARFLRYPLTSMVSPKCETPTFAVVNPIGLHGQRASALAI